MIAISVPVRDFAAILIGCGWVLATKPPTLKPTLDILRKLKTGDMARLVNSSEIIIGRFSSLNENYDPPRAGFAGSEWSIDRIKGIKKIAESNTAVRSSRPEPGSIHRLAGLDLNWDSHLTSPAANLGIIGTKSWLDGELQNWIGIEHEPDGRTPLENIILPRNNHSATWFTQIYSFINFDEKLDDTEDLKIVVLDGNGAIRHLNSIEVPVVFCIIDRSVNDDSGAEVVAQLRNTRGTPLSLRDKLQWSPPMGIEALAFTVPL